MCIVAQANPLPFPLPFLLSDQQGGGHAHRVPLYQNIS